MQKKHLTKYSTFLIKTLYSVEIEGTYLNIMKALYEKPMVKTDSFSPKVRNMTGMSTLTTVLHSTGSPSLSNQTTKEIKYMQIGKEEIKLSLFAVDVMLM